MSYHSENGLKMKIGLQPKTVLITDGFGAIETMDLK